jgi:hypothetical protein
LSLPAEEPARSLLSNFTLAEATRVGLLTEVFVIAESVLVACNVRSLAHFLALTNLGSPRAIES